MAEQYDPKPGINSWFEDELYQEYLHDRQAVDASWKEVFESGAVPSPAGAVAVTSRPPETIHNGAAPAPVPAVVAGPAEQVVPLRGAAGRIAANMNLSLSLPTATSQRAVPVKVIDENRAIINQHRSQLGRNKISYTHLIAWAIVRSLERFPSLNHAYLENEGEPCRLVHSQINLGLAIDVAAKDGGRSLLVPNIKNAGALDFQQFLSAYDDLVARARASKLTPADFQGTTISLTNPGTVGTVASVPRLMPGQGAIIATGAIDYPPGYQGVTAETRAAIGISKVMTMTCTYDHRIIQGAESGMFLAEMEKLLQGGENFYEHLFADLKLPYQPVRWEPDRQAPVLFAGTACNPEVAKEAAVLQLINAYRVRGHLIANLDPLGSEPSYHAELDPAQYGLTIWDLDREFITGNLGQAIGEGSYKPVATLREILTTLRNTYCGKTGVEYMNIQHPEQKRWLQNYMEPTGNRWPLDKDTRLRIMRRLLEAEEFEHFLHARFVGHKRFSLEGAESMVAVLGELLDRAADHNAHEIVMGMSHRGRITVLANVLGKPLPQIFTEFEGNLDPTSVQGSGDVKYHLGGAGVHRSPAGREIVVSLAPNPSHLEAVDPVVEGIVRPKQDRLGDTERARVIPLLIHGDAAFAGQGVVAETLNLSQLLGYRTGGTIHVVVNNQLGFTTAPEEGRSSPYPTDIARTVQAPILHVNGDHPEAVARVAQLAFDYRQKFKKDVVIDMFCYRRHGHNESDDPSYTQPVMYRKIRAQTPVAQLYAERLIREKITTKEEVEAIRKRAVERYQQGYETAQQHAEQYELQELSAVEPEEIAIERPETSVTRETLERVINNATAFPEDFHLHPKLRGFVERKRQVLGGGPIDWATGEMLAFGSLVLEGTPVRLSGQDSGRGTFSQRHIEFIDSENGNPYVPLRHLSPDQARFDVFDSSLSENAVMAFEFGYSVADPLTLVLWEAQFGDFANGAQILIDQFLVSSESKWGQPSGLVLLLPHGYEGQGPEHSSARVERFLQLSAEGNLQVCNATTPAQYFHLLRRQMNGGQDRRGIRKPLIIFTPKSLLRHHKAVSTLEDLTGGGFNEVLGETSPLAPDRVNRIIMCSGKVYYDLVQAREERGEENVPVIRVEQLYPFPSTQLQDILARYPVTSEVAWVQEEPRNMGAWHFMEDRMRDLLASSRRALRYIGRAESASPSAGSMKRHQQEQAEILEEAFAPGAVTRRRVRLVAKRRVR